MGRADTGLPDIGVAGMGLPDMGVVGGPHRCGWGREDMLTFRQMTELDQDRERGPVPEAELTDHERAAFRAQCERSMARPIEVRFRYGFVSMGRKRLRPTVDIAFDSCEAYRKWCKENYPRYSGMWPAEEAT